MKCPTHFFTSFIHPLQNLGRCPPVEQCDSVATFSMLRNSVLHVTCEKVCPPQTAKKVKVKVVENPGFVMDRDPHYFETVKIDPALDRFQSEYKASRGPAVSYFQSPVNVSIKSELVEVVCECGSSTSNVHLQNVFKPAAEARAQLLRARRLRQLQARPTGNNIYSCR